MKQMFDFSCILTAYIYMLIINGVLELLFPQSDLCCHGKENLGILTQNWQ